MLEFTLYMQSGLMSALDVVTDDVVTPYLEKRFGIRIKEYLSAPTGVSMEQQVAMWVATGDWPDIYREGTSNIVNFIDAGIVQPLQQYIPGSLPNYMKYFDGRYWPWWTEEDGSIYSIPSVMVNMDLPQYADDPWNMLTGKWAMWVREDIALQAGYKMTPIAEIEENYKNTGIKPKVSDFAFDPPINTPDDFYEFLVKVKNLDLVDMDGKKVYAFGFSPWMMWHLGAMFDWGYWQLNDDGRVTGVFGAPGAKDWFRFVKRCLDEGLIDPDLLIQTGEQYGEKMTNGRYASGIFHDVNTLAVLKLSWPEAEVRYIDWPKQTPGRGYYDVYTPGFNSIALSNKLPKESVDRLMEFYDWIYTDEGLEIITWGPEEAGLWHYEEGQKRFIDPELEANMLSGVYEPNGCRTYGLMSITEGNAWSVLVSAAPHLQTPSANPFLPARSYPPQLEFHSFHRNLLGQGGADYTFARGSNGDGGANVNSSMGYFWGDFLGRDVATLFTTSSDAEFDSVWENVIMKNFEELGNYSAAIADMEIWFSKYQIKG